uniref:EGF-like calcium-binding domain-containing protein n=1 Tax=Acrobeloides nanus TaxID=290746 RepID=A0A914CST7_9BILA
MCISNVLVNLQTLFNFLCSDDFRITAIQERPCLTMIDENSELSYCLKNVTTEFELEFSNSTAIVWKHESVTCSYVRRQLQCYTEYNFMKSCQRAVQLEYRLLSFFLANISKTACPLPTYESLVEAFRLLERDKGGCDVNGNCHCVDGYRFQNTTRKCVDINECDEGTHLCSQTCRNSEGSYDCTCDEKFYRLAANNRSCERLDEIPIWLYFAHGQSIWNISEDGKNFQLARMGLQKTAMLDVDVKEQRLYYADIGGNVIERKNIDGTFPQPVQTYDVDGVEGIAVDWIA